MYPLGRHYLDVVFAKSELFFFYPNVKDSVSFTVSA